jgi:hypothetical protein
MPEDDTPQVANAYMAGLFDGEGSVVAYQPAHALTARIRVEIVFRMTDREPLELFTRYAGVGNVTGPYQLQDGCKPQFQYKMSGGDGVRAIFFRMKPWLCPRRIAQFESALSRYDASVSAGCGYGTPETHARKREAAILGKSHKPCTGCGGNRGIYTDGCPVCDKRRYYRHKSTQRSVTTVASPDSTNISLCNESRDNLV